jgi:hypothetical protein
MMSTLKAKRRKLLTDDDRTTAMAMGLACVERLGKDSPLAYVACNRCLFREIFESFIHDNNIASELWVWVDNFSGQLGLGDEEDHGNPTELTAMHGKCIKQVACGVWHTAVLLDSGELWVTGNNFSGQLGLGDRQNRVAFQQVTALAGKIVVAVACGDNHTVAVLGSPFFSFYSFAQVIHREQTLAKCLHGGTTTTVNWDSATCSIETHHSKSSASLESMSRLLCVAVISRQHCLVWIPQSILFLNGM